MHQTHLTEPQGKIKNMTNREISAIFQAIGSLLQIRGENDFRARIYERAATIIEKIPR